MIELLEIDKVERLVINPGEVLIISVPPHTLTVEAAQQIRKSFEEKLPKEIAIVIKTSDIDISVLTADEAGFLSAEDAALLDEDGNQ